MRGAWWFGDRNPHRGGEALPHTSPSVRDNLRVKEVRLDDESGKRWIICHNPFEAERDLAKREAAIARVRASCCSGSPYCSSGLLSDAPA